MSKTLLCSAAQLQENKDFHYWDVDFHSIYWRADSYGIAIERVPVCGP